MKSKRLTGDAEKILDVIDIFRKTEIPTTVKEISKHLGIPSRRVQYLCNDLCAKGYIFSVPHKKSVYYVPIEAQRIKLVRREDGVLVDPVPRFCKGYGINTGKYLG